MGEELQGLSFEQAFGQLEALVEQLEGGELLLEEAIALYEKGMHLARYCNDTLDAADLRIQELALNDSVVL